MTQVLLVNFKSINFHFDSGNGVALDDVRIDVGDVVLHNVLIDPVERIKEASNHPAIASVNIKWCQHKIFLGGGHFVK